MDNLEEVDKCLETHNLPRLNHEETENLNRPKMSKEIDSEISHKKKAQDQMVSLVNFTKCLKKN